ncbi:hypothetical protein H4R33_000850 [Dimargaris cristalligena]|uniref:O-acetylhomoserine/O-acetylserine sulfhydrylase n=1 Tax=Dimargaris cristalligena TaxID=215637 RepID=A0A4Q0A1F6_9FUNG|nr:hypothetical protein H4R33_000850 [Dimargaris cristalligena]RKP39122.1 O-acetylhomoserine/O-acetylserine sulfhydrylase [Dimargaris cristalligena]|eukprot:RKP39122.1 O-acetylhomoserine/O-acetylserine sulfhydrylase [Dimargaris cristalligena]
MPPPLRFETLQVHAGQGGAQDEPSRARAVPIFATSSYILDSAEDAVKLVNGEKKGYLYTRVANPTNAVFEERMAALEGGVAAMATSSGQAAEFMAIITIAGAGDNIVSLPNLYGGTYVMFKELLARLGIEVRFACDDGPLTMARLIDARTKALFVESIGNPKFNVPDLRALADLAHSQGIPLLVDNTFGMGGYLIRPLDHGADIVVHSATKWIGGHGTTIGGVIVDAGRFNWKASGRFPALTTPGPDGASYWDKAAIEGGLNSCFTMMARCDTQYGVGACQNPFGAFLLLQGLETLSLRAERHLSNGLALAQWLEQQPQVSFVSYLGLPQHPYHALARKYLNHGFGSMLTFGVQGGAPAAMRFINAVQLASHLANVGDAKTLVIHPFTTTHSRLNEEEARLCGVSPEMVRVSVGIEHIEDIKTDFAQALEQAVMES